MTIIALLVRYLVKPLSHRPIRFIASLAYNNFLKISANLATRPGFFTGNCQNFPLFRLRVGKVHISCQLHNPKNSSLFYDGQIFSSLELPLITKCRWPSSFKSVNSNMFVNKKQCFQRDLSSQITTTLVDCPTQLFCTWIFICHVP